jgi:putative transposase
MPRPLRLALGGGCYHVINRGNGRAVVFHKEADFLAFERILSLACERIPMRLLGWCFMHNHFHLVLWPYKDGDLARWMQWVTTCHVRRYHRHYKGSGHVWQGRYKCFPCQPRGPLMSVLRYVERNPVRAGLVKRAQDWRFSSAALTGSGEMGSGSANAVPDPFSLSARAHRGGQAPFRNNAETEPDPDEPAKPLAHWLVRGPAERPEPWLRFVNREEEAEELARLRECVNRGSPFGDDKWRENAAMKLGLESTIRPRGRPTKNQ